MKIELSITRDGDQICVLYGENLQEGIAGFGDTIPDALQDFALMWEVLRGRESI